MSNGLKPADAEQPCLGKASTLTRLALIGVALAAVVATFAYFGGWFTPHDLTPARFTDAFEHVDGAPSPCRADSLMLPTCRIPCAAWRFSFPCPTANCGEPR